MKKTIFTLTFMLFSVISFSQQITYSLDYAGNTVEKDKYGNTMYTYSTDYAGNIVKKDKYGNMVGTYKKDYAGNWVYYPN